MQYEILKVPIRTTPSVHAMVPWDTMDDGVMISQPGRSAKKGGEGS